MKIINNIFLLFLLFLFSNCSKEDSKIKINSILLFGDSLMSGYGLREEDHLSNILEENFKAEGYKIVVHSESVSGDTTSDGLNRIKNIFSDKSYDLIIIGLGANDMLRGVDPNLTKKNLENIIEIIQEKKINILLTGIVASPTRGLAYKNKFDQIYPELKKKYELHFMPFLLKDVALKPQYNQSDGIHPNSEGILLISNNIKEIILDLM
ncbi:MAG: arylesterase [Candidatus Pelagibacter sp. TMED118]|nr:MAG: arylesterase [Candidatus Pelagibacter sp. TMED118]|tara:strand:- start:1050 stop:1676 length:627 start_codon:yes stop_codon:yes gene_type:complete